MNDIMVTNTDYVHEEIAIIGIAGRYPFADDCRQFWSNLKFGRDSVGECPEERKKDIERYLDFHEREPEERRYRKAAFLEEIDKFDYEFFNISPNEANIMDPHQRLLLETMYHVIEDAGYCPDDFSGRKIGVFTGFPTEYTCKVYQNMIMETNPVSANSSFAGNLAAMLPARISYFLNLHGPAVLVDTSCSSSLTAIHMACQSIRTKDCELSIASGINIFTVPVMNEIVNAIGIVARDGKAKAFDDDCEGVGQGEGVGAVLLKPLRKAMEDGDHIYAVVKSSAMNQDGKSIGITAPSVAAQEAVLAEAWEKAKINPETISYIEAHGTATKLGDPTEISGINRAFRRFTSRKQFCGVGSVKSNIGHTIGAAGVTSVIKLALSLTHRQIPASLHFKKPNRKIDFVNSAVYVNSKLKIWDEPYPIRCGASSFGISGTNCHVVLEEAPLVKKNDIPWKYLLFTIKAKSKESLQSLIKSYKIWLDSERDLDLYHLCYTANVGRKELPYKIAMEVSGISMLKDKLQLLTDEGFGDEAVTVLEENNIWISFRAEGEPGKQTFDQRMLNYDISRGYEVFQEKDAVHNMGKAYASGCEIPFRDLYLGGEGSRISMPGYAFKRNRCWITIPESSPKEKKSESLYYRTAWKKEKLREPVQHTEKGGGCILFSSGGLRVTELKNGLEAQGLDVIYAEYSDHYEHVGGRHWKICSDKAHYQNLFQELKGCNLTQIFFYCPVKEPAERVGEEEFKQGLEFGIYRFYNMLQVLGEVIDKKLRIHIITENTYQVTGTERDLHPYNAALIGLGKSLYWEMPSFRCKCIDVDEKSKTDCILQEISRPSKEYLVCIRDDERYVERVGKAELSLYENRIGTDKEKAVYIIAGGLGRIGKKLCILLSARAGHLVIITRTKLPGRDQWENILKEDSDKRLCEQIRCIQGAEKNNAKVSVYAADISDHRQMEPLIKKIREEAGAIHGVINCAVEDCGKKIADQSPEELKMSFQPKVYGTYILHQLTRKDKLDFFITFSSVMTLISGSASSSYVATNSFLEAFCDYQRKNGCPSMAISWSEWLDIGLSQELMNQEDRSLFKKLPLESALEAFEQLLCKNTGRIIVGEINRTSKIYDLMDWLPFQFEDSMRASILKDTGKTERKQEASPIAVKLKGRKTQCYTDAEESIAKAYHRILGYEELNIMSNFFEMGGDSISAVKICTTLEDFNISLTPSDILKYQTIEKLAQIVESRRSEKEDILASR